MVRDDASDGDDSSRGSPPLRCCRTPLARCVGGHHLRTAGRDVGGCQAAGRGDDLQVIQRGDGADLVQER